MKNWTLKLFSLGIALLLFLFVNSEGNTSIMDLIVSLEVRGLSEEKVVIAPRNRQVRVTIKGPSSLVSRIASSPPTFRIKVPDDITNSFVATLSPDALSMPPYVQVQRIEPSEVEFVFDTLIERRLKVRIPHIGEVKAPYLLEDLVVSLDEVGIRGPRTEVESLRDIETFPLDVRELKGEFSRELSVRLPGDISVASPGMVNVKGRIVSESITRSLTGVPIEVRSAVVLKGMALKPNLATIVLEGDRERIEKLRAEEVVPYIRLKALPALGEEAKILVEIPLGVTVKEIKPAAVHFVNPSGGKS